MTSGMVRGRCWEKDSAALQVTTAAAKKSERSDSMGRNVAQLGGGDIDRRGTPRRAKYNGGMQAIPLADFEAAHRHVAAHAHRTPLLGSRILSRETGFEVRLKAEMFQRTGSYKIRGPLNKFQH